MGPRSYSQHQLGAKVEMVYSLLSMLGTHDRDEMTRTLLAMSSSPESCLAMRQSGNAINQFICVCACVCVRN